MLLSSTAALADPAVPEGGAPPPGGMPAMPTMAETRYISALEIADGRVVEHDKATARTQSLSGTEVSGLGITASKEGFNGLIVRGGRSALTLRNPAIHLSGAGTNDFLGTGAGVLVRDGAALVLEGGSVETSARIAPALVAAENATVHIYNARLVTHGGPLPPDYKPHIGPGMMEPPAPLGLTGTARTLLAMSNSRTYIFNSTIEADGWGALSTDATGGDLYLEANDSTVIVRGKGYGAYADFGAHVVLNRTRVEAGSDVGVIAGKARIDLNAVQGKAVRSGVMIHSVMAFDPAETAELNVANTTLQTQGPVFLVKSANAHIAVDGGSLTSASFVLLDVRKNDDPNATKTRGKLVPGVTLAINNAQLSGDVLDNDADRATTVSLHNATLNGALKDVVLDAGADAHWTARANSTVLLAPTTPLSAIDAPAGVTVIVTGAGSRFPTGSTRLAGGGTLIVAN